MAKRSISGVLLLDKPYGISSNKTLQQIKFLYAAAKSGHTGTLDPLATGMLPICLGEATKFSSVLLNGSKTYEAVLILGYQSTTGDIEGDITKLLDIDSVDITVEDCKSILKQFVGEISQIPPMYSALKYQGKPLYRYARNGHEISRQSRTVFIHALEIDSLTKNELAITVQCAAGTYIRTLAEDIGRALGCGSAYLVSLRRNAIGSFNLTQAHSLSALEEIDMDSRDNCLLPIDSLLLDFPAVMLNRQEMRSIVQGRAIPTSLSLQANQTNTGRYVRLYHEHQFIGLGEAATNQEIKPKRLLSDAYLTRHCAFYKH